MKKLYYIAASLLILAGAASCEKKTNVQEPDQQQSGKMIPFSVTAGQGAKKTSMVSGVLSWTKGDKITVLTQEGEHSTELTLKGNGGSATGEFNGEIADAVADKTELYGLYNATYNSGNFTVSVPASQTYNATSFQEGIFPSIGTGTYNKNGNTSITFQNPMGILRLKLIGTASVKSVRISTANSNLSGAFTVTPSLEVEGGMNTYVIITCSEAVTLTSDGVYFNFVTAPFTSQSVGVDVIKSDDTIESILLMNVAVTASSATKRDVDLADVPAECGDIKPVYSTPVTDVCNNTYKTVVIGSQIWMAENMRCATYSPNSDAYAEGMRTIGTSLSDVYTPYYTDGTANGYGYYYNWAAAVGVADGKSQTEAFSGNRQGICPDGWHVPTNTDWANLRTEAGKTGTGAGKHLKNETGWSAYSGIKNLNCYGFAALPAGMTTGNESFGASYGGFFWAATPKEGTYGSYAYLTSFSYDSNDMLDGDSAEKTYGYSLRCLKD